MKKLDRDFFARNSILVAEELLGHYFVTEFNNQRVVGKIVETEAYSGQDDLACHASKGKTKRTKTLFGPAGRLYVYLNYGIFYLTNIVCDRKDFPSAVLIRAAEIIEGQSLALERLRKNKFVRANEKMASGPGKFSIAFGLSNTNNEEDAIDLENLHFLFSPQKSFDIIKTARVGVDYAGHCKDYPWRFYIKDNKFVSKK